MSARGDVDEDDLSDVSMSAETEDTDSDDDSVKAATPEPVRQQLARQNSDSTLENISRKRKVPSDTFHPSENLVMGNKNKDTENAKRVKFELTPDFTLTSLRTSTGRLPSDRSLLPAEIWHHILTFTPPRTLGRLLRVNKAFRAYLDPTSPASPSIIASLSRSQVPLRQPEVIWQISRRLFRPWMPNPLEGMSEFGMWKLACNLTCEFCGKKQSSVSSVPPDQWHSGPGEIGVRPIWAFAIRACGPCLQQRIIKEIDLLLSSSVPSPLMSALPFVFLTTELHIVASTTLQQGQPPTNMQINKYFLKSHVDEIKQEFFKVKSMGSGTAEEWIKGLDNRGKEKRFDLARWERWEASGGLQRMRSEDPAEIQENVAKAESQIPATISAQREGLPNQFTLGLSKIPVVSNEYPPSSGFMMHPVPPVPQFPNLPPRFDSPSQNGFAPFPRPFPPPPRHERTKEEVDKLKAARRSEIERRCLLLDPPITPGVLVHMASFQAALQIIKPFDDNAWEMLKPRLLSQRADAQQREEDRLAQSRAVQSKLDERLFQDGQTKEVKEVIDREWEDTQSIVRTRIGTYADEIIRDGWAFGKKVNKESSARFAAEVLLYVRKRFYAEIAKNDAAAQAAKQRPQVESPNSPFTRKLSLENMRWVFDTKIKPHTEQYRKELFLCNGCENFKWYAFEGVCQHYASKHTSALSSGSIVVHWRAEWPEESPFNPEPTLGKNATLPASSTAPYINDAATGLPTFGYSGYQAGSGPSLPTSHNPQAPVYHPPPEQYTGLPQRPEPYSRQAPAPFVSPVPFHAYQGFQDPQYQPPQGNGYQPYGAFPQAGFEPPFTSAPPVAYDAPQAAQVYPVANYESVPIQAQNPAVTTEVPSHIPPPVYRSEAYKAQLQDIALIAKGLWNSTSGVKDMLGNVRVYTILHHILQRFRAKYAEDPPLKMLIDGLQNNKDMRPVRNINGIACKTCALERASRPINPHTVSSKGSASADRKLFSFPQLLNHFQTAHIDNPKPNASNSSADIDWTTDMVELPKKNKIKSLSYASGMDEYKLQLIKDAFPDAFKPDTPEPVVEEPQPLYRGVSQEREGQLAPSNDKHERYYAMPSQRSPSPQPNIRYEDHMTERDAAEGPVMVPSTRQPRLADRSPDDTGKGPQNYSGHGPPSPMGNTRRIVRDDDRQAAVNDDRFYTVQSGSYRELDDNDQRARPPRTRILSPRLQTMSSRPEYNYQEANQLPRLIEKAGRLAKPQQPQYQEHSEAHVHDIYYRAEPSSRPVTYPRKPAHSQQQWSRLDPGNDGSEDGEVENQFKPGGPIGTKIASTEVRIAAEQFLNNISPAEIGGEVQRQDEEELRARWAPERAEGARQIYRPPVEPDQRIQYGSRDADYQFSNERPVKRSKTGSPSDMRPMTEQAGVRQPQYIPYEYDDRIEALPRQIYAKRRSPEPIDRRYVVDDVIYRDERQINQQAHPRNGRFIGYDGLRYEDEPPISRSPVYVADPMLDRRQYHAVSPGGRRYAQQESIYESRPPQQPIEPVAYERVPRPEYYRVYPDEQSQPRRPQYETQIEYVRVPDPQGDYVIQRPIRREQREPDPLYATYEEMPRYEEAPRQRQPIYEEELSQRQPIYEEELSQRRPVYDTRAPVSRNDPAYYEEYDPRHPAPPPEAPFRSLRYE